MTRPARPRTQRGLTALGIAFLVVSAASPLSVFLGSAPLALLFAGPAAGVGFLVIGVILLLFAIAYLPMTTYVEEPGAFYSYVARGLGRITGNGAALMTLIAYVGLALCGFSLFGVYASGVITYALGAPVPWWVPALVSVAIVALLGQLNIEVNARILGTLLVIEMAVLAVLAVSILSVGGDAGLSLDAISAPNVFQPAIAIAVLFAFASCLGLESTVVYRGEARDPDRTIPRATYGVIVFIALFHAAFLWIVVQAGGAGLMDLLSADPASAILALADRYAGPWASTTLSLLVLLSILASCLAFHNMLNRFGRKLAEDRLLPRRFAAVSRRNVPWVAGVTQAALGLLVVVLSALAGIDPYLGTYIFVSTPGVFGMLLTMTITAAAAFAFFFRERDTDHRGLRLLASGVVFVLFAVLVLLTGSQLDYLTGLGPVLNTVLMLPPIIAFIAGAIVTLARRRREASAPTDSLAPASASIE